MFRTNLAQFFIGGPNHFTMKCRKNENLEFVQGVNFELLDALENSGSKYLLVFDD